MVHFEVQRCDAMGSAGQCQISVLIRIYCERLPDNVYQIFVWGML